MKRLILGSLSVALISTAVAVTVNAQKPIQNFSGQIVSQSDEMTVIKSGSFQAGEHPTAGTVRLIKENGQHYLEFDGDFQSDRGPDLFVVLHRSNDVIGTTEAPTHSLAEGDYLTIAPLEAVSGTQRYAIPEAVDLSEYQSVAIWCRQFNATFGAASFSG